ncbi:hypothetical protein niasHS_013211 [Heterodera schachtii]|uniref:TRPM tetramerisation domain-containing protein n=1 Tax=Heterodera schachtii TaxID=97005 RepID=A0ABD2IGV4_HETSC
MAPVLDLDPITAALAEQERQRTLVFIGFPESNATRPSERVQDDREATTKILDHLEVEAEPTAIFRVGRFDSQRTTPRPLKVVMPTSAHQHIALGGWKRERVRLRSEAQLASSQQQQQMPNDVPPNDDALNDDEKGENDEKLSVVREQPLPNNSFEQRRSLGTTGQVSRSVKEGFALFDFSLKLFLSTEQVQKLHDFEGECMVDLAREKEDKRNRTSEERLNRTCERTELILLRVNDIVSREATFKGNIHELETRLGIVENRQAEVLDYLRQFGAVLPSLVQSVQTLQQQQQQLLQRLSSIPE